MEYVVSDDKTDTNQGFKKTINWTQGLAIALGVPVLILPSISYFTEYMWGCAIVVWILSIFQGFLQNAAYGELAAMFPEASGLPGFVQAVFKGKGSQEYDISKFIGGFSAWGYWFAWSPIIAIFSILISKYLYGLVPVFSTFSDKMLSMVVGIIIVSLLIFINWFGLSGGAKVGYILAVLSIAPILVISTVPIIGGQFNLHNITGHFMPEQWTWDLTHTLTFLGIMAMAQWSACAWETAAVYAPEYKEPRKDIPKALFSCGFICLLIFILVQSSCIGVLGVNAIINEPYSPMLLLAQMSLGSSATFITILMLLAAMVLVMQTALLGSARAMHSMAIEGNIPAVFGKTNRHGTPVFAMVTGALLNIGLIWLDTPVAILAASALGYVFANGVTLFAYVKVKFSGSSSTNQDHFKAPEYWKYIALFCGILNIPFYLVGLIYINSLDFGIVPTLVGMVILLLYIPLWLYSKSKNND